MTHTDWINSFRQQNPEVDPAGQRPVCDFVELGDCQAIISDWNEDETNIKFCCIRGTDAKGKIEPHLFVGTQDPHEGGDFECWAPCDKHLKLLTARFSGLGVEVAFHQLVNHA